MKRLSILALVAAGLMGTPLAAQQKIDRRIPIAPDVAVRINNLEGTVRIVGWDHDSLAVRGSVPSGAEFYFGGRDRLAKMGVERDPKAKPSGPAILEVFVPRGGRVWVRTSAGGIEAVGMTGELELISVGGTIRTDCLCRLVTAETIDGAVEVSGGAQVVRARTGSGRIALMKLGTVSELTAITVSGPILVTGVTSSTGRLETVSGNVTFHADVDRRGRFEVQTHGGDVELRLPTDIEAEFDLHSLGGTVLFGLLAKQGDVSKPISTGRQILRATGGGGAQITVRSFKGAIRVLPR